MSRIDYENIKPYFLRNVIRLINMGFISYDISTNNWVLLEGEEKSLIREKLYSIVHDSINDHDLKMIILRSNGAERIHNLSEYGFDFCNDVIAHKKAKEDIDLLVRNIFHHINNYPVIYHEINLKDSYPYAKPMSNDNVKTLVSNNGTLLCPEGNESDIEVADTDNFLNIKFEETDQIRILPELKKNSIENMAQSIFNFTDEELIANRDAEEEDIDRFVRFSKTLATANPNATIISKEDKKRLDNISNADNLTNEITKTGRIVIEKMQEKFNIIDFPPAPEVVETDFDKVVTYFVERGLLDKLQFSENTFVTLKSHMIIGTDVFVEAGISELSLKNNVVKIKHMVGQEMEETCLEFAYVCGMIEKGDIYIRPFDMYKGKKIYTVKID